MVRLLKNDFITIRCTHEQKHAIKENAQKKGLSITDYILELNNNSSEFVDKKGLKIILYSLLEPKVAKRFCDKHGIH